MIFGFVIKNNGTEMMMEEELAGLPDTCCNDQKIYVECDKCKKLMKYIPGPTGMMDGYFQCYECGCKCSESDAYDILEKENMEMEENEELDFKRYLDSDESYYDRSSGDF